MCKRLTSFDNKLKPPAPNLEIFPFSRQNNQIAFVLVCSQGFSEIINHLFQTGHQPFYDFTILQKKIGSQKKKECLAKLKCRQNWKRKSFHEAQAKPWNFSDRCDFCPILTPIVLRVLGAAKSDDKSQKFHDRETNKYWWFFVTLGENGQTSPPYLIPESVICYYTN